MPKSKSKRILQILSVSTITMLCLISYPQSAYALESIKPIPLSITDTKAVVFQNNETSNVKSKNELNSNIEFKNFTYDSNKIITSINIRGVDVIDFTVKLVPSQIDIFNNNALLGLVENIDNQYELLSFRIERNSTSYTLMEPNLDMVGKTVLTLGVLDKETNEIYFLNEVIDNINFDLMLDNANNYLKSTDLTIQDVTNIELDYFQLKSNNKSTNKTLDIETNFNEGNYNISDGNVSSDKHTLLSSDSRSSTVIPRVDDSVFKSGPFDVWKHYNNTGISPYSYSYITFNFAGTNNRLTNIVVIEAPTNINWDAAKFSQQLGVVSNKTVLYNIYTGELGTTGETNRISVTNPTIKFTSNTKTGVFNSRYYAWKKQGSILSNITKAVLGYIPYLGDAISTYDTLTTSTVLKTGNKYTYYPTYQSQINAWNKSIGYIDATVSEIKKEGDYFLFESEENGINSMSWNYSYTASYR